MKILILVSLVLFIVNAIASEYNVVCDNTGFNDYSGIVIRDIEDIELAKKIVNELDKTHCKILLVRN